MEWGWRIPYILSVILVLLGLYIRKHVLETPDFESVKKEKAESRMPFIDMWKGYASSVGIAMGARWIDGVIFNIFGVFSISYLTNIAHFPRTSALTGVMMARHRNDFRSSLFRISFGPSRPDFRLRMGQPDRRTVLFSGLLDHEQLQQHIPGVAGHHHPVRDILFGGLRPPILPVRRTVRPSSQVHGNLFVYQFSGIVAGGMTPIIATALLQWGNNRSTYICMYAAAVGIISALSTLWLHARKVKRERGTAVRYNPDPAL